MMEGMTPEEIIASVEHAQKYNIAVVTFFTFNPFRWDFIGWKIVNTHTAEGSLQRTHAFWILFFEIQLRLEIPEPVIEREQLEEVPYRYATATAYMPPLKYKPGDTVEIRKDICFVNLPSYSANVLEVSPDGFPASPFDYLVEVDIGNERKLQLRISRYQIEDPDEQFPPD